VGKVARSFDGSYQVAQREWGPILASGIYKSYKQCADKQDEYFKNSRTSFGVELCRHVSQLKTGFKKQRGEKWQLSWFDFEPLAELELQGVADDPQTA
jgi:hypothetical protein